MNKYNINKYNMWKTVVTTLIIVILDKKFTCLGHVPVLHLRHNIVIIL